MERGVKAPQRLRRAGPPRWTHLLSGGEIGVSARASIAITEVRAADSRDVARCAVENLSSSARRGRPDSAESVFPSRSESPFCRTANPCRKRGSSQTPLRSAGFPRGRPAVLAGRFASPVRGAMDGDDEGADRVHTCTFTSVKQRSNKTALTSP